MAKVQEELYCSPEDAANFLATLRSDPGMYVANTFDDPGRLVNVFWATADQQERAARFGGVHPDGHHRLREQVIDTTHVAPTVAELLSQVYITHGTPLEHAPSAEPETTTMIAVPTVKVSEN